MNDTTLVFTILYSLWEIETIYCIEEIYEYIALMLALSPNTNYCLGCGGDLGTGKAFSLTGYLFARFGAERYSSWLVISRSLVQIPAAVSDDCISLLMNEYCISM